MAYPRAKIESAGFFIIFEKQDKQLGVKCMGESTSITIKSHPQ
ncbi:Uncharacterised protein [Sphingobacterium spiritivorum]|uniref:Uncharacterized protein n=1 Tax=Sphingobacterium spiritivorum TaxID=258 RepID=A0A380BSH2_SPHSI|nr:Uncharacterised protein [Sphingobacterium spiritivorum]